MDELVGKFITWVSSSLNAPEPVLNNLPVCPYAKEAVVGGRFQWSLCEGEITRSLESAVESYLSGGKDIVMFIRPEEYSLLAIEEAVFAMREKYYARDVWIMYDDPRVPEVQGGVTFNFQHSALIIVQSLSRLVEASEDLEKRGYYSNWTKEYYEQVVVRRREYYARAKALGSRNGSRAERILS